jgi:hypothetical protein
MIVRYRTRKVVFIYKLFDLAFVVLVYTGFSKRLVLWLGSCVSFTQKGANSGLDVFLFFFPPKIVKN